MGTRICGDPSSRVADEARSIARTNEPGQLAEVDHLHLTRVSAISHLIKMTTTTISRTTTLVRARLTRLAG